MSEQVEPLRTWLGVVHFYWKETGQYSRTKHELYVPRAVQARGSSDAFKQLGLYARQFASVQRERPYYTVPAVSPLNTSGVPLPDTPTLDGISTEAAHWAQEAI